MVKRIIESPYVSMEEETPYPILLHHKNCKISTDGTIIYVECRNKATYDRCIRNPFGVIKTRNEKALVFTVEHSELSLLKIAMAKQILMANEPEKMIES